LNFAECGIAECGKTLRCNLRNVPQRKFRKIHLTKIPHSAFCKVHFPNADQIPVDWIWTHAKISSQDVTQINWRPKLAVCTFIWHILYEILQSLPNPFYQTNGDEKS